MKNLVIVVLAFMFCSWSYAVGDDSSQRKMGVVRDKEKKRKEFLVKDQEKEPEEVGSSFELEETESFENEQSFFDDEELLDWEEIEKQELTARDMPGYFEGKWIQGEPIEEMPEEISSSESAIGR